MCWVVIENVVLMVAHSPKGRKRLLYATFTGKGGIDGDTSLAK